MMRNRRNEPLVPAFWLSVVVVVVSWKHGLVVQAFVPTQSFLPPLPWSSSNVVIGGHPEWWLRAPQQTRTTIRKSYRKRSVPTSLREGNDSDNPWIPPPTTRTTTTNPLPLSSTLGGGKKSEHDSAMDDEQQDVSSPNDITRIEEESLERRDLAWVSKIFFDEPTDNNEGDNPSARAVWLLNAVAIIWGTQHAVIKTVVTNPNPITDGGWDWTTSGNVVGDTATAAMFTLIRFSLAAALASPYTPGLREWWNDIQRIEPIALPVSEGGETNGATSMETTTNGIGTTGSVIETSQDTEPYHTTQVGTVDKWDTVAMAWRWGAELGVWMFLGFAFQAIGLQYTTAQKSGFLLYLNCKFVPFFAAVLFGRSISTATWLSALVAVVGTALLAVGSSSGLSAGSANDWNVGDLWSIAAAMTSAMFILRMERASTAVADNQASELNAACLWIVALLASFWTWGAGTLAAPEMEMTSDLTTSTLSQLPTTASTTVLLESMSNMVQDSWLAFLYLGGIATAVCNWLQTKAQRYVSAERACVIYAMDPVYGALFSAWWLGESLPGTWGYLGAGLITVAAATNAFFMDNNDTVKDETTSS